MSKRILGYVAELQKTSGIPEDASASRRPISFWKYEMFTTCPLKFKKTILDRRTGPTDFRNALEGSVLHAVMEQFIKLVKATNMVSWSWPEENFDKIYQAVISDPKVTKIGWKTDPPDKDKAKAYDLAHRMVVWSTEFLRETRLLEMPEVHAELPYKVKLLPDLYISGRVDLWVVRQDGLVDIYDWKGVSDITRPKSAQMKMYGLGLLLETKREVNMGAFVCPQVKDIVGITLTDDSIMEFIQNLVGVHDQIKLCQANNSWRADKGSMCKWCPFKQDPECREQHAIREIPKSGQVSFG